MTEFEPSTEGLTPLELSILLHYFARANDFNDADFFPPPIRKAIDNLRGPLLLIEHDPCRHAVYRISARGRALIEAILRLPLPIKCWQMPLGAQKPEPREGSI